MGYTAEGNLKVSTTAGADAQLALALHQLEEAKFGPFERPTKQKPLVACILDILGFDLQYSQGDATQSTHQFYFSGKWWYRNQEVFEFLAHNNVIFEGKFTGEDGEAWLCISTGDGNFQEETLTHVPVSLINTIASVNNTLDEALSFLDMENKTWKQELQNTPDGQRLAEVLLSLREQTRSISL